MQEPCSAESPALRAASAWAPAARPPTRQALRAPNPHPWSAARLPPQRWPRPARPPRWRRCRARCPGRSCARPPRPPRPAASRGWRRCGQRAEGGGRAGERVRGLQARGDGFGARHRSASELGTPALPARSARQPQRAARRHPRPAPHLARPQAGRTRLAVLACLASQPATPHRAPGSRGSGTRGPHRIWPISRRGASGSQTSSPVDSTATCGLRCTLHTAGGGAGGRAGGSMAARARRATAACAAAATTLRRPLQQPSASPERSPLQTHLTLVAPTVARMPTSAAPTRCPARSTTSPAAMSLPTCRWRIQVKGSELVAAARQADERQHSQAAAAAAARRRAHLAHVVPWRHLLQDAHAAGAAPQELAVLHLHHCG